MATAETQRLDRVEEILKHIPSAIKKFEAEVENTENLKNERREQGVRLRELKEELTKNISELRLKADAARVKRDKLREALLRAQQEHGKLEAELGSVKWGYDQKIQECENFLMKSASPAKLLRIEELRDAIEYGRLHIPDPPSPEMWSRPLFPDEIPLNIFLKKRAAWEAEIESIKQKIYSAEDE